MNSEDEMLSLDVLEEAVRRGILKPWNFAGGRDMVISIEQFHQLDELVNEFEAKKTEDLNRTSS